MKDLTRTQILSGKYKYPEGFIKLIPTDHFVERFKERSIGVGLFPKIVKVTEANIHSGKTDDGVTLKSVVVRIKFDSSKFMFICLNPYDGAVKTFWFRNKDKRKNGS